MSSAYAFGAGRPSFDPSGRLVVRRGPFRHGDAEHAPGDEMPRLDLTDRQVALLWQQGWIDTLSAAPSTTPSTPASQQAAKRK